MATTSMLVEDRRALIDYIRSQLMGPANGAEESLPFGDKPHERYLMGAIFPQGSNTRKMSEEEDSTSIGGADETDNPVSMAYELKPASVGLSFFTKATSLDIQITTAIYEEGRCWSREGLLEDLSPLFEEITRLETSSESISTDLEKIYDESEAEKCWSREAFIEGLLPLVKKRILQRLSTEEISAALAKIHDKNKEGRCWSRNALPEKDSPLIVKLSKQVPSSDTIFDGLAEARSIWREMSGGYLVTVTFINHCKADDKGYFNTSEVLHQVNMRCLPEDRPVEGYPAVNRYSWDSEEEDLALVYNNKKTFGIGHGCAANWPLDNSEAVAWIETAFIPEYEVPPVTAELPHNHPLKNSDAFSLQYLSDSRVSFSEKIEKLDEFADCYGSWINDQVDKLQIPEGLQSASDRIKKRMNFALQRMRKGIKYLASDPTAKHCFELANQAMLMQMIHSTKQYTEAKAVGTHFVPPDYSDSEWSKFRWRPFQLAFQILVIESLANRNSTDRDLVDLIWFPTGGGKTEAYLAIAAFELFYRRIKLGDSGGGTAVIKRYTLRLLTTQQFERAAVLICACESIRQNNTDEFGDESFSLGLWVGGNTTPNKWVEAYEKYSNMLDQERPENSFQLQRCPWCGTMIVPEYIESDANKYGIRAHANHFEFFCPELSCDFHSHLPIQVVDEQLYREPPSFLIGTIDKFARLAWIDEPRSFFCGGADGQRQPPSLIIQDELHLIAGPLGTIAGLYEAAMDVAMQSAGGRPKYIAATATIRRAGEQVNRLYARNVAIFPPQGFSSEDSFFASETAMDEQGNSEPGRLYIGVMGQYHTPVTSLVQTCAALLQAPYELNMNEQSEDGYWTQIIFHNSRRELGKTMTLCRDDIPERIKVICTDENKMRTETEPVEMSANIASREIPAVLEQLTRNRNDKGVVDVLPCTNMFSVGVDVQRLGLIVMNGQPKTTAEYIQASSRVGRGKVPGVVVAFYPSNKARDRSQYESFLPYHQSLYRAVEPTSVTPYAIPAMGRALHAAIVIVMRYCAGLSGEDGAAKFDKSEPRAKKFLGLLLQRMEGAEVDDPTTVSQLREYFGMCVESWQKVAKSARNGDIQLKYNSRNAAQFKTLLQQYKPGSNYQPEVPWATLNSMRNIDQECKIHVWGEKDDG